MSPTVSVCLPVYNGGKFLRQSITSVLAQDFADLELLIVDDCSSDDSVSIVRSLAQQDARIKFWQNSENRGLFANYNECISRSSGAFIKPFAQDDILHVSNLSSAISVFQEHPIVSLVANDRNWIDENNEDISDYVGAPSSDLYLPACRVVTGQEVIRQSLYQVVNFIGEPSCVTFRRSHGLDGFDTAYHHLGDLDYWLRILLNGSYYFIDKKLSSFRIHEQSRSSENIRQLAFAPDLVRMAQRFKPVIEAFGGTYEELLGRIARSLSQHVRFLAATQQITSADFKSDDVAEDYLSLFASGKTPTDSQANILHDLLAYRELLFYGFRNGNDSGTVANSNMTEAVKSAEIAAKESRLELLLQSPSWRVTRILRECRATLSAAPAISPESEATVNFNNQSDYREFLEQQIKSVKRSRSWKITKQFRRLGIL